MAIKDRCSLEFSVENNQVSTGKAKMCCFVAGIAGQVGCFHRQFITVRGTS